MQVWLPGLRLHPVAKLGVSSMCMQARAHPSPTLLFVGRPCSLYAPEVIPLGSLCREARSPNPGTGTGNHLFSTGTQTLVAGVLGLTFFVTVAGGEPWSLGAIFGPISSPFSQKILCDSGKYPMCLIEVADTPYSTLTKRMTVYMFHCKAEFN